MTKHARLGPSNQRWPKCPGSVREEAKYPNISGAAAIDGTGSHLLLETCMDNGVQASAYDLQIIGVNHHDMLGGWLVGTERCQRVQMCLDYIVRRVKELKTQFPGSVVSVESESKSNPGGFYLRNDWYGTVDVTLMCTHPSDPDTLLFIEVIDYKDGRGWVTVKDNSQLLAYLGGKMRPFIGSGPELVRPFKFNKVGGCRMTIVQPKTNPPIRYQCSTDDVDMSPSFVMGKLDDLSDAANATDKPDAPLIAGKHCQWCRANPKRGGNCTASVNDSITKVVNMSDTTELAKMPAFEMMNQVVADPRTLTSTQLAELLSAKDAMLAAFDKCEEEIKCRIGEGQNVSGYAMLPGRTTRAWNIDPEELTKKLQARKLKLDDIYPKKIISVKQLLMSDKLTDAQKKKIEEEFVSEVSGKLTLKKVAHCDTSTLESSKQMFADVIPVISFI